DALKSAKPQAAVPVSGPANSGAAQPASGMQTPAASSAEQIPSTVAQAAPAEHVVNCAAPCNQQPCPKNDANCLEGGAVSPPQVSTKPDSSPDQTRESKTGEATIPLRDATNSPGANAETRASGRQEEQSLPINRRTGGASAWGKTVGRTGRRSALGARTETAMETIRATIIAVSGLHATTS